VIEKIALPFAPLRSSPAPNALAPDRLPPSASKLAAEPLTCSQHKDPHRAIRRAKSSSLFQQPKTDKTFLSPGWHGYKAQGQL